MSMKFAFPFAPAGLVIAAMLALAGAGIGRAQYEVVYYPTSWYVPTYSTTTVDRVYVPTAYRTRVLTPTAVTVPSYYTTSYYTTAYYPTASYVETVYRPRLFDRWFARRPVYTTSATYYSLTPTSYVTYTPTSWVAPASTVLVRDPCEIVVQPDDSSADSSSSTPTSAQRPSGSSSGGGGTPPRSVMSTPRGETNNQTGGGAGGTRGAGIDEPGLDLRPQNPVPDNNDSQGSTGDVRRLSEMPAPPLLGDDQANTQRDDSASRTAYRPAATEMSPKASSTSPSALRGEVLSSSDGTARANVRIVFTDARATYRDRERTTDSQGRFDVVLPNGDWDVNIADATGKLIPYGTITSAGGRFYDSENRVISLLRLNQ